MRTLHTAEALNVPEVHFRSSFPMFWVFLAIVSTFLTMALLFSDAPTSQVSGFATAAAISLLGTTNRVDLKILKERKEAVVSKRYFLLPYRHVLSYNELRVAINTLPTIGGAAAIQSFVTVFELHIAGSKFPIKTQHHVMVSNVAIIEKELNMGPNKSVDTTAVSAPR